MPSRFDSHSRNGQTSTDPRASAGKARVRVDNGPPETQAIIATPAEPFVTFRPGRLLGPLAPFFTPRQTSRAWVKMPLDTVNPEVIDRRYKSWHLPIPCLPCSAGVQCHRTSEKFMKTHGLRRDGSILLAATENQAFENKGVTNLHVGYHRKNKKDGKMKVLPQNVLKISKLKNRTFPNSSLP